MIKSHNKRFNFILLNTIVQMLIFSSRERHHTIIREFISHLTLYLISLSNVRFLSSQSISFLILLLLQTVQDPSSLLKVRVSAVSGITHLLQIFMIVEKIISLKIIKYTKLLFF